MIADLKNSILMYTFDNKKGYAYFLQIIDQNGN